MYNIIYIKIAYRFEPLSNHSVSFIARKPPLHLSGNMGNSEIF